MRGWRISTLISDAGSNLTSGGIRTTVLFATALLVLGGLSLSELSATGQVLALHNDQKLRGVDVVVVENAQVIPAWECIVLSQNAAVKYTGALTLLDPIEFESSPGTLFQNVAVNGDMLRIWAPNRRSSSLPRDALLVGPSVADSLGVGNGDYATPQGDITRPVKVIDPSLRNAQANRWVITAATPVSVADQCWIELLPGVGASRRSIAEWWFRPLGEGTTIRSAIDLGPFAQDPDDTLEGRSEARLWVLASAVLTLILLLSMWFRRGELSLYRALGSTRTALLCITQIETSIVVGVAGIVGSIWAAATYTALNPGGATISQLVIAGRSTLSTVLIALVLAPVMVLPFGARKGLLSQLKDR